MLKFLQLLFGIMVERMRMRRAVRLAVNQVWSVEFLVMLMERAVRYKGMGCTLTLTNKQGQSVVINADIMKGVGKDTTEARLDHKSVEEVIALEMDELWG
jgi:hypothetical protein